MKTQFLTKYLYIYLAIFIFDVILCCILFIWIPEARNYLVQEDNLVENLSVFFFIASCFLGVLFLIKRRTHKKLLQLIVALGLICFLNELSFGERMFNLSMPSLMGKKIDAIHDLISPALKLLNKYLFVNSIFTLGIIGILIMIIILLFKYRFIIVNTIRQTHYLFLWIFALLIVSSLFIDLDLIDNNLLQALEELMEMNAGLALLFSCLSLPKREYPVLEKISSGE